MTKKAGTVPFKIIDDIVKICLVSSSKRKGKFVLPKGTIDSSESNQEAALRETLEEAGLKGTLSPQGVIIESESSGKILMIEYFPMQVTEILDDWLEKKWRQRLWVELNDLPESKMVARDINLLNSNSIRKIIGDNSK